MPKVVLSFLLFAGVILIFNASANALCVSASEANLRNGPSEENAKTWVVYRYMPLEKVSQKVINKEKWYEVKDVDGDTHWIANRLVTSRIKCAVVKVNKANVRTKPKTSAPKAPISPVVKYYAFRVIKKKDDWVKVKDENRNVGWISKKLVWIR